MCHNFLEVAAYVFCRKIYFECAHQHMETFCPSLQLKVRLLLGNDNFQFPAQLEQLVLNVEAAEEQTGQSLNNCPGSGGCTYPSDAPTKQR